MSETFALHKPLKRYNQKKLYGIALFILSGLAFATEDAIIKLIPDDFSLFQIIFFANLFSIIPILILIGLRREKIIFFKKNIFIHFLRSLFGLLTVLLFTGALRNISLSQTLTLSFSAPFFMIILSVFLLNKKINYYAIVGLFAGFLGVFIILFPDFGSFQLGSIMALLSGLTYASSLLIIEHLNVKEDNPSIHLYYIFISTCLMSIFIPFFWEPVTTRLLIQLIIIGALYGIGLTLLVSSLRLISVYLIAPFDYLSLVWMILFDYLLFNISLTSHMIVGMLIIVISGIYVSSESTKDI